MVQTLLGDPTPPLLGLMVPCQRFEHWRADGGAERGVRLLQLYFFPQCPGVHSECPDSPDPSLDKPSTESVCPGSGMVAPPRASLQ